MQGRLSVVSTQAPRQLARATEHHVLIASLELKDVQMVMARPGSLRVPLEAGTHYTG
jgi:hypothetical protein